ncbi:MAG: hypothetical protein NC094_04420 [Bacteroidales bacterium]|nr:hypothetical protein [Lachnoclostridium sp.]MCM1383934.1 hypothetical protein [Lachnoclostridium sp.]MCM1464643.1 hypothetical protein [Bacteroidales bacterium]
MNPQVEEILELIKNLYEKGIYDGAWKGLSETYHHIPTREVRDMLLEYFYYPNEDVYQENYKENMAFLLHSKKVYGYSPKENAALFSNQILWIDAGTLYYLKDTDIKCQDLLKCSFEEAKNALYVNITPKDLPQCHKDPLILYYDEEVFECYLQLFSFSEILERTKMILVGAGLEEYILQFGEIGIECIIGGGIEVHNRINHALKIFWFAEKRESFGTLYGNYTFYVIRVEPITSSIGGLMLWVLKQLKEACERGCIPVIDFSPYMTVFVEDNEFGIINPWEYYFEQPTQFSLQAVYHAKDVIVGNAECDCSLQDWDDFVDNAETLQEYIKLFDKYVHMSKRIEKKSLAIYETLIKPEWRVLGVVYRGTDYKNRPVIGEHRQPDIEELIQKTVELMSQWKCDHVFLATEDAEGVERFKQALGAKLIYTKKERYPSSVKFTQTYRFKREFDAYLKGEEYLTEIYILSKCNCLLSGRLGILAVALPMNAGRYEHKYIYDLGIYTEKDYNNSMEEV